MSCNRKIPRYEILSQNVKKIKDIIRAGKLGASELGASKDGVDFANLDPSFTPWVPPIPNHISLIRSKIGKSLLKPHRNGFLLNDPHMHESRFCVEYHRMQDPALKRYFSSTPVKKRLQSLGVVTKQNNVLCSAKDLAEYLRYLESLRALETSVEVKNMVRILLKLFILFYGYY